METLLRVVSYVTPLLALVGFLVAAISALQMARLREPGVTRWHLATHGLDFYSGKGFSPAAAPHRRRFLQGVALFFIAVVLGMVSGFAQIEVAAPP